jgi:uncharacterized damage-inducible protein DinB
LTSTPRARVERPDATDRPGALAARLREAAATLIAVVARIDDGHWRVVPSPGVWSIGKEAEHVAEAASYHQWIVRLTIGQEVSKRRPPIERNQMTTGRSPREVAELIRQRTDESVGLLLVLTDDQLDLLTRPPRARGQHLGATIERVLIGHYDTHRAAIEAKLSALE